MKQFEFNKQFIQEHIDELVHLEDYVPFDFREYGKQAERESFLKPKHLLIPLQNMHKLLLEKCEYSDDPVKAWDSVIIEWLDCHPEFEGIIATDSIVDYQNMKINISDEAFINLLYSVELPSEKKIWKPPKDNVFLRDDSSIQLPNFKLKDEIHDKYGLTLLANYLSYLV